jgi:hypothetical protein
MKLLNHNLLKATLLQQKFEITFYPQFKANKKKNYAPPPPPPPPNKNVNFCTQTVQVT